jgi:hypothetical protein
MRQFLFLFILFIGQALDANSQAQYKIKSCKIDFVFAGGKLEKGTKTLTFTDSGKIEKELSETFRDTSAMSEFPKEVVGNRIVFHQLLIHTADSIFYVDLDSMTGTKRITSGFGSSSFISDQMTKIKEDTFLNKTCEVMNMNGVKLWYWKGIVLKKEFPINGLYEYATSIDENYVIKEDEFKVPKSVKMQ